MLIHAYRRKAPIQVELFGRLIEFAPNDAGDIVAAVEDKPSAERLLSIDEAYRAYGGKAAAPVPAPAAPPVAPADPLVLTNDAGETLDLRDWPAKRVRAFAADNNVTLPSGNSTPVAELRALLAQALRGEE